MIAFHVQEKQRYSFLSRDIVVTQYFQKIYMTKGNGEGRDLLRYIRNGIAHGNATIFSRDHTYLIELINFDKDAKT